MDTKTEMFAELTEDEMQDVDGGLCCLLGLALGAAVVVGLGLAAAGSVLGSLGSVSCAPAPVVSCKPAKKSSWC